MPDLYSRQSWPHCCLSRSPYLTKIDRSLILVLFAYGTFYLLKLNLGYPEQFFLGPDILNYSYNFFSLIGSFYKVYLGNLVVSYYNIRQIKNLYVILTGLDAFGGKNQFLAVVKNTGVPLPPFCGIFQTTRIPANVIPNRSVSFTGTQEITIFFCRHSLFKMETGIIQRGRDRFEVFSSLTYVENYRKYPNISFGWQQKQHMLVHGLCACP
jgi:hypothetical protein